MMPICHSYIINYKTDAKQTIFKNFIKKVKSKGKKVVNSTKDVVKVSATHEDQNDQAKGRNWSVSPKKVLLDLNVRVP